MLPIWWEGALKEPGWAEAAYPDQPGPRLTADSAGHRAPLTKGSGAVRPGHRGGEGKNRPGALSVWPPQWRLSRGVPPRLLRAEGVAVLLPPPGGSRAPGAVAPRVVQFSSVTQLRPTLCDPMNRSTPGLPVHHQLPEFTQTHNFMTTVTAHGDFGAEKIKFDIFSIFPHLF